MIMMAILMSTGVRECGSTCNPIVASAAAAITPVISALEVATSVAVIAPVVARGAKTCLRATCRRLSHHSRPHQRCGQQHELHIAPAYSLLSLPRVSEHAELTQAVVTSPKVRDRGSGFDLQALRGGGHLVRAPRQHTTSRSRALELAAAGAAHHTALALLQVSASSNLNHSNRSLLRQTRQRQTDSHSFIEPGLEAAEM